MGAEKKLSFLAFVRFWDGVEVMYLWATRTLPLPCGGELRAAETLPFPFGRGLGCLNARIRECLMQVLAVSFSVK